MYNKSKKEYKEEEKYKKYKAKENNEIKNNSESTKLDLEKLAKERKKRLELIKIKEQKKLDSEDNEVVSATENIDTQDESKDKNIFDDADNEFTVRLDRQKIELTAEEVELKKQLAIEEKNKKSARDLNKEKIEELEKQVSKTKYNKKTQHAIGLMKAQIATLKTKMSGGKGKGGASDLGYSVRRSGDATAVLLGFPSSGKSTLLNKTTGQKSEVGAYAFTTLTCIPGMLEYKHSKIQILDVPGIVEGAASGSGRGKEVLQVIRNADLVIMLIDGQKPQHKNKIEKEVWEANVRLNKKKPDIKIKKKIKDGIDIGRTVETPNLDDDTIIAILRQFRVMNADILIRDNITADDLIDAIELNKAYLPSITVVSKSDLIHPDDIELIKKELKPDLFVSAHDNYNIEELKDLIFNSLKFIRIYLKEINNAPDMEVPMIMREGDTLKDLCSKLHKDFIDKFVYARIWGPSAKFDGQKLMKQTHILKDEDIIEIHLK